MQKTKEDLSGVHIWLILMKAFHSIAAYGSRGFRQCELGESDFRVMEVLLHKGPLPVNTIGPKVFLTPGSISVAVDRLYEKGLVSRVESQTDRRVRVVDLTAKGRKLITQIFAEHAKSLEDLADVLTAEERRMVAEALRKIGKRAAELTKS